MRLHEGPSPRRRTLARRLAWTLSLTAVAAATVALGTALLLADALVVRRAQSSVENAVRVLAAELDESPSLAPAIEDEARELGIDMRVAVARGTQVIAGDPSLVGAFVLQRGGPCALDARGGEFVCGQAMAKDHALWIYTAVPEERLYGHRASFAWAAAGVLLVVLLCAGAAGTWLSRWFLAPLERFARTVVDIDASAPAASELSPPTGLEEIDALRAALANLLARLEAELTRTRTFAANAAHELRTPLTKLGIELELAIESAADADAPDVFARLRSATARLGALTERLLLLATPEKALENTAQGTSMSVLAEALTDRRVPEEVARLRIETTHADGLVKGDPVLLAVVLDNAVDNALKFSEGPVTVTVREDVEAARVVVDVDDEGPGVSEDRAVALFEPFARGPSARREPGHGLGLALCAHVTRAYGGEVRFVLGRDAGARLRIELPLVQ